MGTSDSAKNVPLHIYQAAFSRVKENHGTPGIDGITVEQFEKGLPENLTRLKREMEAGTYRSAGVRGVEIPKKSGGARLLGIPTVRDRVAQTTACLVLEPFLEEIFLDDSFAYRRDRSALDAVSRTMERCRRLDWILVFDIKGLFDSIDHEILMKLVARHTQRPWLLSCIRLWLKAPMHLPDGSVHPRSAGTPQGGAISPVLANLYMHYCFDLWIQDRQPLNMWTRYADDALIHFRTFDEAVQTLSELQTRLAQFRLEISTEKSKIAYCADHNRKNSYKEASFSYLGYTFTSGTDYGPGGRKGLFRAYLNSESIKHMKVSLKEWKRKNAKKMLCLDDRKMIASRIRGWRSYSRIDTSVSLRKLMLEAEDFLACLAKENIRPLPRSSERGPRKKASRESHSGG